MKPTPDNLKPTTGKASWFKKENGIREELQVLGKDENRRRVEVWHVFRDEHREDVVAIISRNPYRAGFEYEVANAKGDRLQFSYFGKFEDAMNSIQTRIEGEA